MARSPRSFAVLALIFAIGASGTALAKKHKEKPLKSIPGGASQKWACEQLAESGCDLAKRCEPDRSLRHCRKIRARCENLKDRGSHTATEDDVTVCAQAVSDLSCKSVSFDNTNGVNFDLTRIETCNVVSKDNPLPAAKSDSSEDDDEKSDKDSKGKSDRDDDDQ